MSNVNPEKLRIINPHLGLGLPSFFLNTISLPTNFDQHSHHTIICFHLAIQ
ncbi:hypothetical protein YC2023_086719 [Brassica napus]|uniref:Uncharacterized protein n=1 Tax=Brassica oleracea var. oleracea TaxID=109376 RepID=A0A0D3DIS4_BRAOL